MLITTDTLSGIWAYTRELVTALTRRGVRITLVSWGEIPSDSETEWMDGLRGLDFRPTGFRLEWMRDAELDLEAAATLLLSLIAESKPDVLHLNHFYFGSLETKIPKVIGAHSDVLTWWRSVHATSPDRDDRWIAAYRAMVERGIQQSEAVVAPSKWMLSALQALYGRGRMSSVIYPGRTPSYFNPHLSKEMIGLSVGRIWDFGKNSALLSHFESPLPLYLVGPDPEPANPINHRVFTPRQRLHVKTLQSEKQLRLLYAKSALYVATSQYEPFGMNTVDAALSRCAIVASDIPSHREVWGDAAVYFRSNDAGSLEAVLKELNQDRELCATYGKLAYDHARTRYAASRMAEDWLALYQAVSVMQAVAA